MSLRFDAAKISNYEELPDGRLRVMATISRVGDLKYLRHDGSIQVETVPPETLFEKEWLNTVGLAPVTLGHPPVMVTPETYRTYAVGSTGSKVIARQDEGLVDVVFVIGDQEAIDSVKSGKTREVSAGYTTKVVEKEDGKLYQTLRRLNHVALVERARAGSTVRLHLDSADDYAVQVDADQPITTNENNSASATPAESTSVPTDCNREDNQTMKKKWKSYEIDSDLYDAIQAEISSASSSAKKDAADESELTQAKAALQAKVDEAETLQSQLSALQAKVDMLQPEVERLKAENATKLDSSAIDSEIKARLDAWESTKVYLPKDAKFDSALSPTDMKRNALKAANDKLNLDNKDEAYINAAFEMLTTMNPVAAKQDEAVEEAKPVEKSDAEKHLDEVMTSAQIGGHEGKTDTGETEEKQRADAAMGKVRNAYESAYKKRKSRNSRMMMTEED